MPASQYLASLLAAVTALSTAAAASSFEYNCDTAAGAFSELKQARDPSGRVAVSGTVLLRRMRVDRRWLPVAAFSVKSNDDLVILRVAALERDKGPLALQLITKLSGKETKLDLGAVPVGQPVPVSISAAAGDVTATIGSETRQIPIPHDRAWNATVSCSTGEFLFTDLRFND